MTDLQRVRIAFGGSAVVGAGVATLYTTGSAATLISGARTMFNGMVGNLPTSLRITYPTSGEIIDSVTGHATGSWTAAAVADTVGTDTGLFSSGVGLRIRWETATFSAGRRVRGSTYIVPVGSGAFTTAGTPNATMLTSFNGLISTFVSGMAGALTIYSRPTTTHPVGGTASVTSGAIPPKVSWLISRRT